MSSLKVTNQSNTISQYQRLLKSVISISLLTLLIACNNSSSNNDDDNNAGTTNNPPTASAGADQSIQEGTTVQLSGNGTDAEGAVIFAWTQTTGATVTLINSTTATASFQAPDVNADTQLEFTLTVTDSNGVSVSDAVIIIVTDNNVTGISIGGTITGNDAAVILSLNGIEETFNTANFTFTQTIDSGEAYAVQFISISTDQVCVVRNNGGIANTNVTNVEVSCSAPITVLQYSDAEITGHLSHGDFNGDGFTDLVFTIRTLDGHPSGSNNRMLRVTYGNSAGSFVGISDIPDGSPSDNSKRGHILISGKFNADTLDDFAFSSAIGLEISAGAVNENHLPIYRGGTFVGSPLYSFDVDANGFDDFVSIILGGSTRDIFGLTRNNGDDTFSEVEFIGNRDDAEAVTLGIGSILNFVVADFNGDTVQDILSITHAGGNSGELALVLFSGQGSGDFGYPNSIDFISDDLFLGNQPFELSSKELAFGDFDKDGDEDIAITSTTSFIQIMLNDGTGSFSEGQRVTVGDEPIHVRVADFNNDGNDDLVTLNLTSKTAVISLGNGDGSFANNDGNDARAIVLQLDPDVDLYDINVTDIDGDGFIDIVFAEDGTNPLNTGRGSVQIILAPTQ